MTIEEAVEWMQEEKASFERAPDLNGCPMTECWQKAIEVYEMAISAIRQQELFCEVTKKVEPLTLDELRKMDGEPVWVQSPGVPEYGRWAIVEGAGENCLFLRDDFTCHDYGKTWLAYRQKPEEDDQ